MKNSFLKEHGIKSKNSLYLITSNDYASYQTFAQGSNYTVKDGYVKLTFPDVVKLQLQNHHQTQSLQPATVVTACRVLSMAYTKTRLVPKNRQYNDKCKRLRQLQ